MAQAQFRQAIQQISKDSRPMKITCIRQETTEGGRILNNSLAFENKSFIEAFGRKEVNK